MNQLLVFILWTCSFWNFSPLWFQFHGNISQQILKNVYFCDPQIESHTDLKQRETEINCHFWQNHPFKYDINPD